MLRHWCKPLSDIWSAAAAVSTSPSWTVKPTSDNYRYFKWSASRPDIGTQVTAEDLVSVEVGRGKHETKESEMLQLSWNDSTRFFYICFICRPSTVCVLMCECLFNPASSCCHIPIKPLCMLLTFLAEILLCRCQNGGWILFQLLLTLIWGSLICSNTAVVSKMLLLAWQWKYQSLQCFTIWRIIAAIITLQPHQS